MKKDFDVHFCIPFFKSLHAYIVSQVFANFENMKLSPCTLPFFLGTVVAFTPSPSFVRQSTHLNGFDLSGNTWKPDSEKMGSTDTGDYYPEGYDPNAEIAFSSGMMGSQEMLSGGNRGGPQLPGLENIGADAVVQGGIAVAEGIPPGMEFIPSSVPDGEFVFQVASSAEGKSTKTAPLPCRSRVRDSRVLISGNGLLSLYYHMDSPSL